MPAHSPRSAVIAAAAQAREAKADLIVTLGGGSITDGAKAVQLCLANDITTVEGLDKLRNADVKAPTVRQVSIPTTLSAGEFSGIAGVTNEATKVKELFRHPLTIPQAVILDPEVTRHTPMWLFLSTGIRAVDHCVEGVCSNEFDGVHQRLGPARPVDAGARPAQGEGRSYRHASARLDCQIGSWLSMGGLAAGVPMGASHGIGYVLGAVFDVPHGHTSCIMLPWVMRWNKSANADRQALIANAMGHPGKDAGDVLDEFIRGLGMPRSLGEVKIGKEHFDRIATQAMGTPWVPRNPRKIDGPAQVKEILELAA